MNCTVTSFKLQKTFVREESSRAREEGKMYVHFKSGWSSALGSVHGEPCPAEWQAILKDDSSPTGMPILNNNYSQNMKTPS